MVEEGKKAAGPEESFADLLHDYEQGRGEGLKVGDKVECKIVSIGADAVFVDTGAKADGVVAADELKNEEGVIPFAEGDVLQLYVVDVSGGQVKLARALSGAGSMEALRGAYESRVPVEGKVKEAVKGGFSVEVMRKRAFCPVSQMDIQYVEDPSVYVDNTYEFMVIKFEQNGRNVVLSRRELLAQAQKESAAKFQAEIKPGAIIEGTVSKLMPYGAFVELMPGLEGMAHISELSWSRVDDPSAAVQPGQRVKAKVLAVEPGKKEGRLKISLSLKQTEADPWTTLGDRFQAGDTVQGKVIRLADFGAFVEIAPGIEGLVHVSEMSYTRRISKPSDVVNPGQEISVKIKDVDLANRRISLSLRDTAGDPWEQVPEKFKIGQAYSGVVEKQEAFGIFIQLEPGVTGLLPRSRISKSQKPASFEALKPGDTVQITVDEINPTERKITLGTGEDRGAEDWKKFSKPAAAAPAANAPASGFSTLGQKLQEAMKKKK
ncbi:SSU ribosomal protein S1P [Desulfocurvibacter africanus PCS]|uniref:SSU ribosomal protein S1P n=1 Tax=Desulfocurvibacter africanus PCS TaxID=1262666 RepID=M5Q349_DESAF|nr:30S ribosomal protein S1 [Desulfocurvibacter africanus]EMG39041.1 SSU ribosomal protein S1P [Desulfocurvibacter africanus PCS]